MGLSVCVGMLAELLEEDPEGVEWFDASVAAANLLLVDAGLPTHVEPRSLEVDQSRASIDSFPYSFIHYLRRAYAHRAADRTWLAAPLANEVDPCDDPILHAEGDMLRSHLLCHSDAEGFYFPIDFAEVLFAGEDSALPGGMLGSSFRLLDELIFVAPALGILLDAGQLSDAEAARVDDLACTGEGLCREYCSWLALYEAARQSIAFKTAIVFC
jgi:hypothetical protein